MTHPSRSEREQFFGGENTAPATQHHIENCEQCSAFIAQLKQAQEILLERESPSEFVAAIVSSASEKRAPAGAAWFQLRVPAVVWAMSAALLIGGISVFVFLKFKQIFVFLIIMVVINIFLLMRSLS